MAVKKVLITGAAKRVGAACSRMLHDQGCSIFIHYRNSADEAMALYEELNQKRPDSAVLYQADLLQLNELSGLVEAVNSVWGGLDVLVNNASLFYSSNLTDCTEQEWDELMGSNLKAPYFLCSRFAQTLKKNNGCVVNIVDIHSERGLPGYSIYSIAKAGLAAMTRILAKELAPQVRVNSISPGAILWPERDVSEAEKSAILARVALQRIGEPEDIAKAVRFLIEDADYVTGQIMTIDGGRTLFS